ncbi:hypothetical protein KAR91_83210, partial [Candidatus Pacearchaeota archaeon]|nr:hypothetical protein [Candidatus Pacearchaeota archaeon]
DIGAYEAVNDDPPGIPSPLWVTTPTAQTGHQITMEATQATDVSGVEYFFDCIEDDLYDSGWQDSPSYTATGVEEFEYYTFEIKVRDKSLFKNSAVYLNSSYQEQSLDETSPEIPVNTWEIDANPQADTGTGYITMTASTVTDDNNGPVEYWFECVEDNSINSGWVSDPSYTFTSLDTSTHYTFVVKARDEFGNETVWFTDPGNITASDVASFVDVEFFVTDAGSGQVEISYMTFGTDTKLRSIALEVVLTGATITLAPDINSIVTYKNPGFNCFMDYASSYNPADPLTAGHPLAAYRVAGVPDFSGGDETQFAINMAYYNPADNTDYAPGSSTIPVSLIKLQLTGTGTSTVAVDKDTFRGSTFVNKSMTTNLDSVPITEDINLGQ